MALSWANEPDLSQRVTNWVSTVAAGQENESSHSPGLTTGHGVANHSHSSLSAIGVKSHAGSITSNASARPDSAHLRLESPPLLKVKLRPSPPEKEEIEEANVEFFDTQNGDFSEDDFASANADTLSQASSFRGSSIHRSPLVGHRPTSSFEGQPGAPLQAAVQSLDRPPLRLAQDSLGWEADGELSSPGSPGGFYASGPLEAQGVAGLAGTREAAGGGQEEKGGKKEGAGGAAGAGDGRTAGVGARADKKKHARWLFRTASVSDSNATGHQNRQKQRERAALGDLRQGGARGQKQTKKGNHGAAILGRPEEWAGHEQKHHTIHLSKGFGKLGGALQKAGEAVVKGSASPGGGGGKGGRWRGITHWPHHSKKRSPDVPAEGQPLQGMLGSDGPTFAEHEEEPAGSRQRGGADVWEDASGLSLPRTDSGEGSARPAAGGNQGVDGQLGEVPARALSARWVTAGSPLRLLSCGSQQSSSRSNSLGRLRSFRLGRVRSRSAGSSRSKSGSRRAPSLEPSGSTVARKLLVRPPAGTQVSESHVEDAVPNTWSRIDPASFRIRGPSYLRDRLKVHPVNYAVYEPTGVDVFWQPCKLHHVAQHVDLPAQDLPAGPEGIPRVFIVSFQIPLYPPPFSVNMQTDGEGVSIVLYFQLGERFQKEASQPARDLLRRFMSDDCEEVKGRWPRGSSQVPVRDRLKLIVRLVGTGEGDFGAAERSLLSRWNEKPVLTRPEERFHQGPNCVEVDLDIHRYGFICRRALFGLQERFKGCTYDMALVIQGNDPEELPEQVLACARINKLDFSFSDTLATTA